MALGVPGAFGWLLLVLGGFWMAGIGVSQSKEGCLACMTPALSWSTRAESIQTAT